ncbi:LytTR family two component transcriptional regulator [Mucilaginibacter gracilis]|uniref:LytTR family two component transcriptional regulator n=2 Tax=Mucilaginibacter gracilis TaxID=423350 RepID=A0A495J272_9SPHI|nr:LytTR family two component transcriptional regulator [Mucilaginibacter gracilis]
MVVDDEPLALELLADYIAKIPGLNLIGSTSDGLMALGLAKSDEVDLVFLDMQMPELNGLQFMKILQRRCMVIITTAYSEYALDGYEYHVIDYLLKPITIERFMIAVEKAQLHFYGILQKQEAIVTMMPVTVNYIFIKSDYRIVKVNLDEIYYLEGARDYVIIHTMAGQTVTQQSLKSLEELLPANLFVRVHKSYIIALAKINFIERSRISINQQLIPISDTYKDKVAVLTNKTIAL